MRFNLCFACPQCKADVDFTIQDAGKEIGCPKCSGRVKTPELLPVQRRAIEAAEAGDWEGCVGSVREAIGASAKDSKERSALQQFLALALRQRAAANLQRVGQHSAKAVEGQLARALGVSRIEGADDWVKSLINRPGGANVRFTADWKVEEILCGKCPLCGKDWSRRRQLHWRTLPGGGRVSLCGDCVRGCLGAPEVIALYNVIQSDLWEASRLDPSSSDALNLFTQQDQLLKGLAGYVSPVPPSAGSRFLGWLTGLFTAKKGPDPRPTAAPPPQAASPSAVSGVPAQAAAAPERPAPAAPPAQPAAASPDPVKFGCPGCGKVLKAPASATGRKVKCPGCGAPITVPAAGAARQAPAPTGPPATAGQGGGAARADAAGGPRYNRRTSPKEWAGVFAELAHQDGQGALQPQLWLLYQKPSMAVAVLTKRPESAAALLAGVPELVEFSDGQTATVFPVKSGRNVLGLLRALFSGDYGSDKPVVLGGAAACAPSEDVKQILQLFGRAEALSMGSVAMW